MQKILLTAGFCLILATMASSYKMVCDYDRKAATRPSASMMNPRDIDPTACDHITFSSASINNENRLVPAESTDTALYTELNNLKASNPQLKTLLTVGGPNMDNHRFSSMMATEDSRRTFRSSAIELLKQYKFDGLNLYWQNPGGAGSQSQDKTRFTSLCQELSAAFNALTPPMILSASVSANKTVIDNSYEVAKIAPQLNFINVLTFGMHSATEKFTAHHSPLNAASSNPADTKTTSYALNYWKSKGAPQGKLNMGIATYGVAFTLTSPNTDTGVGAAASGPAEEGCFGVQPSVWSYYEICLYTAGGQFYWLSDQQVPYAVSRKQWVGYDSTASLDAKAAYITANGFGGAYVSGLDLDDFTGVFCKQGISPLIRHLHGRLIPGYPASTGSITRGDVCNGRVGVIPNPEDNTTFYNCDRDVGTLMRCPAGLVFTTTCSCCDNP